MLGTPRWRRWALLAALAATLGALSAAGGRELGKPEERPALLVRVSYGDSLWTIAREHGDPSRDVREVVAEIRRVNGVDPGKLRPGSVLVIPAECLADSG